MQEASLKALCRPLVVLALAACVVLGTAPSLAQVTTGTLTGSVTSKADGSTLPGVTIEATHQPTGTRYATLTGANGRYVLPNVRVGGPYRITASFEGFAAATADRVEVQLGTATDVPIRMTVVALEETVTVTARADELINPNRTGAESTVAREAVNSLPTVNRSLQDFARTNPYFAVDQQDQSSTRLYVAGRNNRYNTIQIDGAVNNDLFGLADTGTPGGQTNTNPISLDAIQQLQLVVSPYDVRQGGFTGGGVNAITRSGSNTWTGSLFGTSRNESTVGDGPRNRPVADFKQKQYGGRLGGPIIKDKLFFFVSGEINERTQPTGVAADGTATTQFNNPTELTALRTYVINTYRYDPGSIGDFSGKTDSNLAFARLDWNIGTKTQLTLRHNYVDAVNDVIADRSSSRFRFPTSIYTIANKTNSTVLQVNSIIGKSGFNEARVGFQTIRDKRQTPVTFPSVEIGGSGPRNGVYNLGTERFSGANSLDQDVLEITNDFTWVKGNHTLVFGTHNEIFEFKNLFLSDFYGYYYFPTFAAFQAGQATEYSIGFATGSDPRRPTAFKVAQYGFYINDSWRVSDSLTLNLGLRADKPSYPDTPSANPLVQTSIGYRTNVTASEQVVLSPRVGFNWSPTSDGKQQLRGGVGVFAGRTPYVWLSNAYANTGVESLSLVCRTSAGCTPPAFNPDPFNQPRNLGAGGVPTVDLVDPDFELPRVMRATLAYDRTLPLDIRATAEVLVSRTQKDVFYYNVNRVKSGNSPLDGRPTYARVSTAISDAPYLTNTDLGRETIYSLQLSRPFAKGLLVSATYTRQSAKSAFDGTSSRAISNWQFRPTQGDLFQQTEARSMFEVKDRFTLSASYTFNTGNFQHTISGFYNAQSGRPYSIMLGGDPNADGFSTNDLLYVPANADAIILQNNAGTVIPYSNLAYWLELAGIDPVAGRILQRNESFEPWSRQLDLRYGIGLPPIKGVRAEVTFDLVNALNLLDRNTGSVRFVSNQTYTVLNYRGIDGATGKPIYREASTGSLRAGSQFSLADTRSRWQARVGLRVSF